MEKPQIYFDTLPSCGRCQQIKPFIEQIARANGAEFYEMDSQDLHDAETIFLPAIYVYPVDGQRVVFDGTETVGEMEAALTGKPAPSFLENPFLNIQNNMENAFEGIVEIMPDGSIVDVEYEDENDKKDTIILIVILVLVLSLGVWWFKFK